MGPIFLIVAALLLLGVLLVAAAVILPLFPIWINARASGVSIGFMQLLGMRLRRIDPAFILHHSISIYQAGIQVPIDDLEAHVLAGGDLYNVAEACVSADKANLNVSFDRLAAIDLAGRDVLYAVEACVNPKVLVCPPPESNPVMGVAKDGIRLNARVRVTVRTDLSRLVGGANAETVVARVGEGIVAAIGTAESHKLVLENPELIAQYILGRGLDSGTSFEIVSVDVSDVDVVDNVGARLQEEQAESDKQVAQARAEMRRVMAVAREREMRAKVVDMTAQLTAARAIVPTALSNACHRGNIWRSPRPVISPQKHHLWDPHEL